MRYLLVFLAIVTLLALTGCAHVFETGVHSQQYTQDFLPRATLVITGVIEEQAFEPATLLRAHVKDEEHQDDWKILRRRIRVESVLFGSEPRKEISVYEVFPTGGKSGDWNSTREGERFVLPLYEESGYYRPVRDFWRSLFPVTTGPHDRLPFVESKPLWERIALMNWWVPNDRSARISYPYFTYADPAQTLSLWRKIKLERGLVRHPSSQVKVSACIELLDLFAWGQDECWEMLSPTEREHIHDGGATCCTGEEIHAWRAKNEERGAAQLWETHDREGRRILTAINNRKLRTELCLRYNAEYPGDTDTGCPADRPPPATIVTEQGDVPLVGDWPR